MNIMSKGAAYLLDNGAKYRFQLKGKQLENVAPEIKELIKGIPNPIVKVGVNGRGAEGSVYGVQVFANGSKKPVASAAGRIDYRGENPMLQARGFVRNNAGDGDALRANVMLDTNKRINIENMDEVSTSKKGNNMAVTAVSDWLKADVKGDKGAVQEILAKLGFASHLTEGRATMAKEMSAVRESIIEQLNKINPLAQNSPLLPIPPISRNVKFVDVSVPKGISNAEHTKLQKGFDGLYSKISVAENNKTPNDIGNYVKSLYK